MTEREPPDRDSGAGIVAETLAPELGSSSEFAEKGKTDMRILSVIDRRDIIFLMYAKIRGKKSRVWKEMYDEVLHLRVSVGGRGRRDIIRMEGVARGGMASVEGEIQRPNWLVRNVTQRGWEQRQRDERGI